MIRLLVCTLAFATLAGAAVAQSSANLDAFLTSAKRIPVNPTALLRTDARLLAREAGLNIRAVKAEAVAARRAGRRPLTCPPRKVVVNPQQLLGYFNTIPRKQRLRMSVKQGFRHWMADRYPCRNRG